MEEIITQPSCRNACCVTYIFRLLKQQQKLDATFMTSFNDNDGVPSTGNKFILKNVLREEWKYDGMVVTDWASATEMITHGFGKDAADAAKNHLMQESIWIWLVELFLATWKIW